jgi:quercetin dioxygenase-like cupin family protein
MLEIFDRRSLRTLVVVMTVAAAAALAGASGASAAPTTTQNGITRMILAQAEPENAPGQTLYLQEVRIAPKAKLATHLHEGTQVASVRSGVLTYDIVSGTATVTRRDGTVEQATGPTKIKLRPGDAILETPTVVHFGSNAGKKPVVIFLSSLLADGAPLATPVPETPPSS